MKIKVGESYLNTAEKLVIMGGTRLQGEVDINGAKNAAVAVIPAALLVDGVCRIENIPKISDVDVLVALLIELGGTVKYIEKDTIEIDCRAVSSSHVRSDELVRQMRASYYLLGALLGRYSEAHVALPGGCNFGTRPIDQHYKAFEALGARVSIEHGIIHVTAEEIKGAQVYFDAMTVGGTINAMLAACKAQGLTVLENCSKEPQVVDVANFINAMGGNIKGAGTDVIKIYGVRQLNGGTYSIIPDNIEAGTFMIAAAATYGDVTVRNVIPKHLESVTAKLMEMNVKVEEFDDSIRVYRDGDLYKTNIKSLPYPSFATDLQPQMVAFLSTVPGVSYVTEGVWDNRFQYVEQMCRLGADIKVDGRMAVISGVDHLTGSVVAATDLRAGIGMVIAGLMARGVTEITNIHFIDRGYENIEGRLRKLGANIIRKKDENPVDIQSILKQTSASELAEVL